MLLFALAYAGGVLTIVSPCILPVLPFVFTRAGQPFWRAGAPMLAGMALGFALVATLAAVAGNWVLTVNQAGRWLAMTLFAVFGLALLWPGMAARLSAPVVTLGGRLSRTAQGGGVGGSVLLGVATGLLWAPCAGPILGLILTGAAIIGPNANTSLLLFAYAAGAATSLALALLLGTRVLAAIKRTLGIGAWTRRAMGALVLVAVSAIALGLDTGLLTQLSSASTNAIETRLIARFQPAAAENRPGSAMMDGNTAMMQANPAMMAASPDAAGANPAMMRANSAMVSGNSAMMPPDAAMMAASSSMMMSAHAASDLAAGLPVEGQAPALNGVTQWLNSPPLTIESLKGKVVLIDFWTYSCINCLRAIPYVRAWAEKYQDQGLVVIGVHTPEFAFERNLDNVRRAMIKQQIAYPVAVDNRYAVWRAWRNQYWPAHYFIDAQGRIRHHHFGEGDYAQSERVIQQLLAEAGQADAAAASGLVSDVVSITSTGAEAAPDFANVLSPETYIGFARAENFVSPGGVARDAIKDYADGDPRLNEWGLQGAWLVQSEHASLHGAQGGIVFGFHARDLHLVLGPGADGKPVRFVVTLDGMPPGAAHGVDVNAQGEGLVTEERLYQLIRQSGGSGETGEIRARRFEIRFLDPGVQAYVFTFG